MTARLPIKLEKEPLIDAIFEMRFSNSSPASEILPGLLFGKLEGKKSIENLPASQVPKPLRDVDPKLQFAPITRLNWNNYTVNIGNRVISIGCNYPYSGWIKFRAAIIEITSFLKDIDILQSINRYSMKYIDLVPSNNIEHQISLINMDVSIAGHKLKKEAFMFQIEIARDGFINLITIVPSASAKLIDGSQREGIIIDVDTIHDIEDTPIQKIINDDFHNKLNSLHQTNKAVFFDCLKPETITELGPIYE
ncbi:MAG: TIGR04255 family protein [Candidatus Competibacteraceae bacterium]|nr:TIGR04255 family protein [Candidatus Competibacteraceae bacterium]